MFSVKFQLNDLFLQDALSEDHRSSLDLLGNS